jgi:hypothetical protein
MHFNLSAYGHPQHCAVDVRDANDEKAAHGYIAKIQYGI